MPSALTLNCLTKAFGGSHAPRDTVLAVSGVDLDVGENELLAMVGPSGCAKSTVLRLMASLEAPTSGSIYMGAQRVSSLRRPPPRPLCGAVHEEILRRSDADRPHTACIVVLPHQER